MRMAIASLGTALPPTRVNQEESVEAAKFLCCHTDDQAALMTVLYRQTEIEARHVVFQQKAVHQVLHGSQEAQSPFIPRNKQDAGPTTKQRMERYQKEALPLALEACRKALDASPIGREDITHIVTVSCTGFAAPGVDVGLIKGLGLPATTERTHVGFMGCHAALNGLRVARGYAADPQARVLLCAVELCSLHYYYGWNPKRMVGNALFADGAAALVGVPTAKAPDDAWVADASGACLFPDSEYAMTWHIGDHGFDMGLSTRIPNLIGAHLRPFLEKWLHENGLTIPQVASWAVHPGGPRILLEVEDALGLDKDATAFSREVLHECGNMSSPTVLFIIDRMRKADVPRPCVAMGFGPGLAAEVALFR